MCATTKAKDHLRSNIDVLHQKDAVRRVLGYLPQEFGLYPKVGFSAFEKRELSR